MNNLGACMLKKARFQFPRIAWLLLCSSAVSSSTCCIDPSFKLQENCCEQICFHASLERATTTFRVNKSGHKLANKAFFFKILSFFVAMCLCCICQHLVFSKLREIRVTYRHTNTLYTQIHEPTTVYLQHMRIKAQLHVSLCRPYKICKCL